MVRSVHCAGLTVPIFSGPRHVSSVLASLFVLAIVVASAACGQAQTTAAPATTSQLASVSGIATDAGGAALVGVTVTLTGPATLSTATDAKGAYTLTKVPPGMYGLAAMRGGFETAREGKVAVTAGTSLVVNVTLAALSLTTLRVIGQTSTEATRSRQRQTRLGVRVRRRRVGRPASKLPSTACHQHWDEPGRANDRRLHSRGESLQRSFASARNSELISGI
jgi:hypothetical protein